MTKNNIIKLFATLVCAFVVVFCGSSSPEEKGNDTEDPTEEVGPEKEDPGKTDPENPDPENPDPENPDPENPEPEDPDTLLTYTNPVWGEDRPDPTVLYCKEDGYFYLCATGKTIKRGRSKDLVNWESMQTGFTADNRPQHVEDAGCWAPDLEYINGKYYCFYSQTVAQAGGNPNSCICVATCDRLTDRFTDRGVLIRAKDFGIKGGCIDEFYWEEGGKKYLFLGSFRGLWGFELADDALSVKDKAKPIIQLANDKYEGGMLYKRGKYYYLFASIGSCCDGKNSTYQLVVGRSENLFGPYTNKNGYRMLNGKDRLLLSKSDRFVGPGHCSEVIEDKNGDAWLLYHAYDMTRNNGDPNGRLLLLDKIDFDEEGWPTISNGKPSSTPQTAPVF